jgi:hypothetical protein
MAFNYAELASIAAEIISEFGGPAQLIRKDTSGTYDPTTGKMSETSVTQGTVAVVFPIDRKLINGTTVLASDETAYISTVGVTEPKATDTLTLNGQTYTIMSVAWIAPAGLAVLGELIVRR